jgi:hypothetical protein
MENLFINAMLLLWHKFPDCIRARHAPEGFIFDGGDEIYDRN